MRKEKEKKIDGTLLVTVWILLGLGLVILYSASAYNGRVRFHDPAYYFKKQLFASALGVIGMYAVAKIDYRRLLHWHRGFMRLPLRSRRRCSFSEVSTTARSGG